MKLNRRVRRAPIAMAAVDLVPQHAHAQGETTPSREANGLRVAVLTMIAVGLLASGCGGSSADTSGASSSKRASATAVRVVSPVTSAGIASGYRVTQRLHGVCEDGSDSVAGAVYRCFSHGRVLDPCWMDPRFRERRHLLCLQLPWERILSSVVLHRPPTLPPKPANITRGHPWGVQLATGERCVAVQGAHSFFRGRPVDYVCPGTKVSVLRGLDQSKGIWTATTVLHRSNHPYYTRGGTVQVRTAWYADGRQH